MGSKNQTGLFLSITGGRLLLFVLLVGAATLFPGSFSHDLNMRYLSLLLGCAFLLTLVWIYWFKKSGLTDSLKNSQTVTDVILASLAVYLTGGIESRFTFLYTIAIVTACLLGPTRIGSLSALLSTLCYALVCLTTTHEHTSTSEAAFTFFLNMAAFNTVALLALYLSKRLKKAEDRLQATTKDVQLLEEIQRHLANSLRSGLITLDTNGSVLYYNIAAQEILGKLIENSYGKRIDQVLPGIKNLLSECNRDLNIDKRWELNIETQGKKLILGISCFQIADNDGGVLGHGLIFQDITEIKAQEEKLKLIDRLAALGEMAAGLAHEIRNPLASISGAAEFLAQSGLVMPEGQRLLTIIQKETQRLSDLTSSFLLYGRPEKKKLEDINLKEEFSAALILLSQRKKLQQAAVEMDVPDDLVIKVDADMLRQVILNLLLNAFQALPKENGKIKIKAYKNDGKVYIEISDNGVGIPKDKIEKIFNPFFTTKPEGTGLGLSIVHRIITELDGHISVHSSPGKGTVFEIVLSEDVESTPEQVHDQNDVARYVDASRFNSKNLSLS